MALGKYSRIDNRRSASSYCSTVSIVIFVGLCLVGVWMMTSSSVVPVQNVDVPQENKNEVKGRVSESYGGNTPQFEDNPGDLPEDATKGDVNVNSESNSNSQKVQDEKLEEKLEEKPEEKLEEKPDANDDTKSDDGSKTETEDGERKTDEEETKTDKEESNSDGGETKTDGGENGSDGQGNSEEGSGEKKSDLDESEQKSNSNESEKKSENLDETKDEKKVDGQIEEKVEQNDNKESEEKSSEEKENGQAPNQSLSEVFPSGAQSELLNETTTKIGAWSTQATESKNEEAQTSTQQIGYTWKLCNVTAGPDYIPCLDNWQAIRSLRSTKHYEHRERHCPEEAPTCLVSLPEGYRRSIEWPKSREKVYSVKLCPIRLYFVFFFLR